MTELSNLCGLAQVRAVKKSCHAALVFSHSSSSSSRAAVVVVVVVVVVVDVTEKNGCEKNEKNRMDEGRGRGLKEAGGLARRDGKERV